MKPAANQFSVKQMFVAVSVFGVLFSILGSAAEDAFEVARNRGLLPRDRPRHADRIEISVAEREQRIEERKRRDESRHFRGNVSVAATAALAGLVITPLLVRRVMLWNTRYAGVSHNEEAMIGDALHDTMTAIEPDNAMRRFRFSLTQPLVVVCAALIALSIMTSWFELRWAWRNATPIPGLRQGHPYWETEAGRQLVRRMKMSRAELIWIERTPESFRFRVAYIVGAVYCLLLLGLLAHDSALLRSRRLTMEKRSDSPG